MTNVRSSRLLLHPIDVPEAERIVAQTAGPGDAWADDFPFEGDVRVSARLPSRERRPVNGGTMPLSRL